MATDHPATLTWVLRVLVMFMCLLAADPAFHFDYVFANLHWGPSYVFKANKPKDVLFQDIEIYGYRFTVHGLWFHPSNIPEIILNNFLTKKKELSSGHFIQMLIDNPNTLNRSPKYWPSFDNFQSENFWYHEWKKHGRLVTQGHISTLQDEMDYLLVPGVLAEQVDNSFNEFTNGLGLAPPPWKSSLH